MSAKDKDQEPGTFMIQACRCRRCGGLLTSKEGVRNGIGHVCRMKALREMPDPNQVTVFDVLGDKEENTHEKIIFRSARTGRSRRNPRRPRKLHSICRGPLS